MTTDILDELFYGRLSPWEEIPKDDPDIAQLIHQQSEISVVLEKSLGGSDRKLFSQYTQSRADLETLLYCHYFKKGFLMGVTFTERMHP